MNAYNTKFKLRMVKEFEVLKIIKQLKSKKSCGQDGITSEIPKLGAKVLVVPLTYIINNSILTGKYPTDWKLSKVLPLHKKGDESILGNYRPVALLSVAGMILEKVVALQIEDYFERNNLLGKFQFGFRKNKSTISELLTLYDTLLDAKEKKKEIIVLLYDLSSAFDTVSHQILIEKLTLYGFDNLANDWTKSFLEDRKQMVTVNGKLSSAQKINIGTPQGSRLSPLLFLILMADLDMWVNNSMLSNFGDDTQSIILSDKKEDLHDITIKEANSIIDFFECNNLVNNANKAALLCHSKGKGGNIIIESIGNETLKSISSEKLLGLHIDSDLEWNTHIEKISIELKKRIGLLKRIKQRISKSRIIMVAEAIFNSTIRYGIAIYLIPIFHKEDLKMKKQSKNAAALLNLQNKMIRVILGLSKKDHINMQYIREKIGMMSINQMAVYHTLLEAINIVRNSASNQIQAKWLSDQEKNYDLRSKAKNDLIVPEKPRTRCIGFTYNSAKLFNMLPNSIKEAQSANAYKILIINYVWKNIPSY